MQTQLENLVNTEYGAGGTVAICAGSVEANDLARVGGGPMQAASLIKLYVAGCVYENYGNVSVYESYAGETEALIGSMTVSYTHLDVYKRQVYVSSKAAVIGVTKHTALRFQNDNIRCNAVCPGNILTPMTTGSAATAELDQDMIGAMATHSNLRTQSCTAEDVANSLLFLASDESRAITGQVLVSDFGAML